MGHKLVVASEKGAEVGNDGFSFLLVEVFASVGCPPSNITIIHVCTKFHGKAVHYGGILQIAELGKGFPASTPVRE